MNYKILKEAIIFTALFCGYIVIIRAFAMLAIDSVRDIYKNLKGCK